MRILAGFNSRILQAVNGIASGEDREITKNSNDRIMRRAELFNSVAYSQQ